MLTCMNKITPVYESHHKSHLCMNRNFFSYDIAVVMHLLLKQASIRWILNEPDTINRLNIPGCGQYHLIYRVAGNTI